MRTFFPSTPTPAASGGPSSGRWAGNTTRTGRRSARSAGGNAPATSPRPPVLVSGAHSETAKRIRLPVRSLSTRIKKKTPVGGPGSDTYIRTKGGRCACKGGLTCGGESLRSLCGQFAREVLVDGNLQAHRAVGTAYAKRTGQRRRLLGGLELDHACDARRAAIVDKAK